MRLLSFLTLWAWALPALAAGPAYNPDPFEDGDFIDEPLILDQAFPNAGRGELALSFMSSITGKYNDHLGALVDFRYQIIEAIGVGVSFGWMNGKTTNIVAVDRNNEGVRVNDQGILGIQLGVCQEEGGCTAADFDPKVPDFRQITSTADVYLVFSPLYGKINLASELNLNLQFYGILGVGVNGTRQPTAEPSADFSDYEVVGQNLGDGGIFSDPFFHITWGLGAKIYILDWLNVRAEFRSMVFFDEFDFGLGTPETYASDHYFGQVGFGFVLF